MEKKNRKLRDIIREKWEGLSDGVKGMILGGAAMTIITSLTAGGIHSHYRKASFKKWNEICDNESRDAYYDGFSDGQIRAYRDLLMQPDKNPNLKKMGLETGKF